MEPKPRIELAPEVTEIGLALILEGLISQNLEDHPERRHDFQRLGLNIGLKVVDAEVELTLHFRNGLLRMEKGVSGTAKLVITTHSDVIMALSNQRIKWGLPYYFDQTGRDILKAMRSGRLQVKGLLHLPSLIRFSRVMSVAS
jgi:hypothetical protein